MRKWRAHGVCIVYSSRSRRRRSRCLWAQIQFLLLLIRFRTIFYIWKNTFRKRNTRYMSRLSLNGHRRSLGRSGAVTAVVAYQSQRVYRCIGGCKLLRARKMFYTRSLCVIPQALIGQVIQKFISQERIGIRAF